MDIIKELRELSQSYRYGKFDLLDRMDKVSLEKAPNGQLVFKNWFNHSLDNDCGDCEQISTNAFAKIKQKFPDLPLSMCWGYDYKYFNEIIGWHAFLLAKIDSEKYVIDPSLGIVTPLEGSGYRIEDQDDFGSIDFRLSGYKKDLLMDPLKGIMFGVHPDMRMVFYLNVNPNWEKNQDSRKPVLLLTSYWSPPDEYVGMPSLKDINQVRKMPKNAREIVPILDVACKLEERLGGTLVH